MNTCCGLTGTSVEDTGLQPHEVSLVSGLSSAATAFLRYNAINTTRCGRLSHLALTATEVELTVDASAGFKLSANCYSKLHASTLDMSSYAG